MSAEVPLVTNNRQNILPQRRKGAKKDFGSVLFLCAFAPLRENCLRIHTSEASDDCRSRMIFWISHNGHLTAVGPYHVTFGHRLGCVVRAFCMDVGFKCQQQLFDRWLVKNRDVGY